MTSSSSTADCRPLLKWAGGKRQLLPHIREYYPSSFSRYIEPFLGSGAVFFDLASLGHLDDRPANLSDCNRDLIGLYQAVRDQPDAVIQELETLATAHASQPGFYYDVRDRRFNPARARGAAPDAPAMAAMLLYLNRTGFNGLYRVNSRGGFNVPEGRYANPQICDPARISAASAVLRRPDVTLTATTFDTALGQAGEGDFVYCDPPYVPLSPTARFAQYTAGGFGESDQRRLQQAILAASRRGAAVVVSNSSAPLVLELFSGPEGREAGLMLRRVPARRSINVNALARGPVDEVLVVSRGLSLRAIHSPRPATIRPVRQRA